MTLKIKTMKQLKYKERDENNVKACTAFFYACNIKSALTSCQLIFDKILELLLIPSSKQRN